MFDIIPGVSLQESGAVCEQCGQTCSYYVMFLSEKREQMAVVKACQGSGGMMWQLWGEDSAVLS